MSQVVETTFQVSKGNSNQMVEGFQSVTWNLIDLAHGASTLMGLLMILYAMQLYAAYRENSQEVRLGQVIGMLLAGLLLIAMTYVPVWVGS